MFVQSKDDNKNGWLVLTFFDNHEEVGEMAIGTVEDYVFIYRICSNKPRCGYGTKMIEYLQERGYTTIAGDADPDSVVFWNKFNPKWKEESFEIYTK